MRRTIEMGWLLVLLVGCGDDADSASDVDTATRDGGGRDGFVTGSPDASVDGSTADAAIPASSVCGDAVCDPMEDCASCASDCGACGACGDRPRARVRIGDQSFEGLQAAIDAATPGDTVVVGPGYVQEAVTIDRVEGTAAVPLTIRGAGSGRSVISGMRCADGWTREGDAWSTEDDGEPDWVTLDKVPLAPSATPELAPGSYFFEADRGRLVVRLPDDADPATRLVEIADHQGSLVRIRDSAGVHVEDLGIEGSNDGSALAVGSTDVDSQRLGSRDIVLERLRLRYGKDDLTVFDTLSLVLRHSHLAYSHRTCITGQNARSLAAMRSGEWGRAGGRPASDVRIDGNLVELCNTFERASAGGAMGHAGGMKLIPSIRGWVTSGNLFRSIHGPAIWYDHPQGENRIEGNRVVDADVGIFYEIAEAKEGEPPLSFTAVIANNLVDASPEAPVVGTTMVDRNQGIYVSASVDVTVRNNTVLNSWAPLVMHGMPRGSFELRRDASSHNVLETRDRAHVILFVGEGSGEHAFEHDYFVTNDEVPWPTFFMTTENGYSGAANPAVRIDDFAAFFAETGFEEHGANGPRAFEDPEAGDYSILVDGDLRGATLPPPPPVR